MKTFKEITQQRREINPYPDCIFFRQLSDDDLREAKFALKRGSLIPKSGDVGTPIIQHAYDNDEEARWMRTRIWFTQGYQMRKSQVLALLREAIVFFMHRKEPAAKTSLRQLYRAYNFIA